MHFHYIREKIKFTPVVNRQGLEDKLTEMDYFQGKRLDQNVAWNITGKRVMHQLQEEDKLRKKAKEDERDKKKEAEDAKDNKRAFSTVQQFLDYVTEHEWYHHSNESSGKSSMQVMH